MAQQPLGFEGVVLASLVVAYALVFAIVRLRRSRPDLRIVAPVVTGVVLRLIVTAGIAASGAQTQLRGGDEQTFLFYARYLAASPWGSDWLPHGKFELHTDLFALQIKLADLSEGAIRITQVGLATLGVILVLASVHDLAGPRPARLAGWLLAIEPASIFFSGALHKESMMMFASGLVVFGGTKLWRRLSPSGAVICAIGCVIAVTTRDYAGWFLVSASVLILLHAALKRLDQPGRAMPIVYAVVAAVFLIAPTLATVTSDKSLARLQVSQSANATGAGQGTGGANSANLALEEVDFSTRSAVVRNLPQRMYDLVFRPYPWQLQNASQQLGAIGTLYSLAAFAALVLFAWRRRGHVLDDVAPLFYPWLFLMFAYSLSAGNAGTGFRYRTHLVLLALAMVAVLREQTVHARAAAQVPADAQEHDAPSAGSTGATVALDWH